MYLQSLRSLFFFFHQLFHKLTIFFFSDSFKSRLIFRFRFLTRSRYPSTSVIKPGKMSRSMHGPWIKNCLMGMLAGEESYSAHQTRCVQVIAVKADARALLISDTEIAINAFLTEECFNELLEIYPIETIKQSQINLSEFYFSTVSQAAGNMDMEFLRNMGICPPFALHCFKVDYLGASDSTTIGKPSDVNQSHALIGELRKFKYADLLDRLAERQYPLPRLLKTLPDWGMD